jgi:hypothetical protein
MEVNVEKKTEKNKNKAKINNQKTLTIGLC